MGPTDGRNADKRLCDNCSARRLSPVAPTTNSVALSVHNQRNSVHTTKIEDHIGPKELGREYVLDPCPPPLTLAQKLGLVEAPRALLTEQQWGQVKAASNARQDSCLPCPICKEQFGMREQVSLSLSCLPHGIFGLFFVVNRYPLCFSTIHDLTQSRPHSATSPLSHVPTQSRPHSVTSPLSHDPTQSRPHSVTSPLSHVPTLPLLFHRRYSSLVPMSSIGYVWVLSSDTRVANVVHSAVQRDTKLVLSLREPPTAGLLQPQSETTKDLHCFCKTKGNEL